MGEALQSDSSGGHAGRAINLLIYAGRSPLMFDKEAKFNFFLQALNPRPASRARNLPTAWLSHGWLHRLLLEAKLAWERGHSKATVPMWARCQVFCGGGQEVPPQKTLGEAIVMTPLLTNSGTPPSFTKKAAPLVMMVIVKDGAWLLGASLQSGSRGRLYLPLVLPVLHMSLLSPL